jgi:hypothetical protein
LARRWVGRVEEVVEERTVHTTSAEKIRMNRMPGKSRNVLLVALEQTDVSHHAKIEYASGLISSGCCQTGATDLFEQYFSDSTLVAVESC